MSNRVYIPLNKNNLESYLDLKITFKVKLLKQDQIIKFQKYEI